MSVAWGSMSKRSVYRRLLYSNFVGDVRYITGKCLYKINIAIGNLWLIFFD